MPMRGGGVHKGAPSPLDPEGRIEGYFVWGLPAGALLQAEEGDRGLSKRLC